MLRTAILDALLRLAITTPISSIALPSAVQGLSCRQFKLFYVGCWEIAEGSGLELWLE